MLRGAAVQLTFTHAATRRSQGLAAMCRLQDYRLGFGGGCSSVCSKGREGPWIPASGPRTAAGLCPADSRGRLSPHGNRWQTGNWSLTLGGEITLAGADL